MSRPSEPERAMKTNSKIRHWCSGNILASDARVVSSILTCLNKITECEDNGSRPVLGTGIRKVYAGSSPVTRKLGDLVEW